MVSQPFARARAHCFSVSVSLSPFPPLASEKTPTSWTAAVAVTAANKALLPRNPHRPTSCAHSRSWSGCRPSTWGRATRTRRRGSGGPTSRATPTRASSATRHSSPTSPSPSTSPPPRSAPASSAPCSSPADPRPRARATNTPPPPPAAASSPLVETRRQREPEAPGSLVGCMGLPGTR